ncbi:hypothetical protein OK351_09430 [Glutamicibacter sp. MNS18]|uniref:hypothetical protein n=1 Tax=Glutamicibacter sp. MNS18 TaxID=2989817 RepID=UPI0022361A0C|nr:hypothetical protein [Glutamicibacter sp. MNS18]MCW4465727.1 hypothetical protein [Glutamicibacter sp. MNS18]
MSHDHDDEVDLLKWPGPLPGTWHLAEVAARPGYSLAFEVFESDEPRGRCDTVLCAHSEIKDAYPVSGHDQLLEVSGSAAPGTIQLVSEELMRRDPQCRRLVIAPDEGDVQAIARAEAGGYRYVVDVDLWDRAVSLMTAEPDWVLEESRRIDEVPTR